MGCSCAALRRVAMANAEMASEALRAAALYANSQGTAGHCSWPATVVCTAAARIGLHSCCAMGRVAPPAAITGDALLAVALRVTSLGGVRRWAADWAMAVCVAPARRGLQSCCSLACRAVGCRNGPLLAQRWLWRSITPRAQHAGDSAAADRSGTRPCCGLGCSTSPKPLVAAVAQQQGAAALVQQPLAAAFGQWRGNTLQQHSQ